MTDADDWRRTDTAGCRDDGSVEDSGNGSDEDAGNGSGKDSGKDSGEDTDGPASVGDVLVHETTLTAADVDAWADATGDANPVHVDGDAATGAGFEGRIVHGSLLLGVVGAAVATLPGTPILREQSAIFERPATVGETVRAVCTLEERLRGNRYRLDTVVEGPDGRRLVAGEAIVVLQTDGREPDDPNAGDRTVDDRTADDQTNVGTTTGEGKDT